MAIKSAASKRRPLANAASPSRTAVRSEIRIVFMADRLAIGNDLPNVRKVTGILPRGCFPAGSGNFIYAQHSPSALWLEEIHGNKTGGDDSGCQPTRRSRSLRSRIVHTWSRQTRLRKRDKFPVVLPQGPGRENCREGAGQDQWCVRNLAGGENRACQCGCEHEEKCEDCFHRHTLVRRHNTPIQSGKFRQTP